jgi:hypothetical protein
MGTARKNGEPFKFYGWTETFFSGLREVTEHIAVTSM